MAVDLTPPLAVRRQAQRGLRLVREGKAGDGLEDATVERARKIAAGETLTPAHVRRMHSFFSRHEGGRGDYPPSTITPWDVAWALWGGTPGQRWAARRVVEIETDQTKETG